MTRDDVIPLPDHLRTCGCPRAERGWHVPTCRPARAHEADPDRYKGYPDGTRFQGIMWDFPYRITAQISYEVEIEPGLFIEQHRARYDAYEMDDLCEPWEKPLMFISSLIEEDIDGMIGGWFGHPRHVSRVDARCDEISEYPRWTPEATAKYAPEIEPVQEPQVVDPNQGDLFT